MILGKKEKRKRRKSREIFVTRNFSRKIVTLQDYGNWNFKRRGTVRRFLITVNWPRSKLRLTGRGQDIFSQVLPRLKFTARGALFSSRQERRSWEGGGAEKKSGKTVFLGQPKAEEIGRWTKEPVSTNEPSELTRVGPGGKKFHAFDPGRVSNFCPISPSDLARARTKTCAHMCLTRFERQIIRRFLSFDLY